MVRATALLLALPGIVGCEANVGAAIVRGPSDEGTTGGASTGLLDSTSSGTQLSSSSSSSSSSSTSAPPETTDAETGDGSSTGAAPPFSVLLEAELADLVAPFEIVTDPDASDGEYILVPGIGGRHPEAEANFAVDAPNTGRYKIWPRILPNDIASNSLTLEVDGELVKENWTWPVSAVWVLGGDVEISLATGSHQITVRGREAGTQLDYLVVTGADGEPPVP